MASYDDSSNAAAENDPTPLVGVASYNQDIVAEFRANGGKVGGSFEGAPLLLLTTTGRRSGQPRTSPAAYSTTGSRFVITASNAGSDRNPSWFENLQANPDATIEVGDRSMAVRASVPTGAERDRLWAAHVALLPAFANYESATERTIPVVVLEPVDD